MAVEKEPSITYESFVIELDTGDSFTLSLVDILVKVRRYFNHFLAALIVLLANRNSLIDEPEKLSAIGDSLLKTQ
jgi:hypothetical protein